MKNRIAPFIILVISIAAIGVLLGQLFYKSNPVEEAKETYAERMNEIKEADESTLKDLSQDPKKVYGALMRRAQTLDPSARAKAESLLSSPNQTLKEAAYQAIGFYADAQANEILENGIKTENAETRPSIIRALGFRQSEERTALIQKVLDSSQLNEREMILALEALVKVSNSQAIRDKSSHQMLKVYEKSKSPGIRSDILLRISKNNPGFAPLEKTLLNALQNDKETGLHVFAIKQLSAFQSKWLKENLSKFIKSKDLDVKIAAIGVLPSLCPKNRWSMIEEILFQDRDRRTQLTLHYTIKELGSQKALILIEKAKSAGTFSQEELNELETLESEIQSKAQLSDSCELKNKSS